MNHRPHQTSSCRVAPARCGCWSLLTMVVMILALQLSATAGMADTPISREYQIKAVFLYNIPKFVEWPADSFANAGAPVVIGVLGANPFGDQLEAAVKDRKINGRDIIVRYVDTLEQVQATHLLFVSGDEDGRFALMRDALQDSTVLTVGETEAFVAAGGGLRFVPVGDKLSFEINMSAADRAHLKISSQLQKLATAIRRGP